MMFFFVLLMLFNCILCFVIELIQKHLYEKSRKWVKMIEFVHFSMKTSSTSIKLSNFLRCVIWSSFRYIYNSYKVCLWIQSVSNILPICNTSVPWMCILNWKHRHLHPLTQRKSPKIILICNFNLQLFMIIYFTMIFSFFEAWKWLVTQTYCTIWPYLESISFQHLHQ